MNDVSSEPPVFDIGQAAHQGQRDYQEDAFSIVRPSDAQSDIYLLLADGMGGHAGGQAAASTAIKTARGLILSSTESNRPCTLKSIALAANDAVASLHASRPELSEAGCTFVVLRLRDNHIEWASVGDSPLYLVSSGNLVRLNEDHSMTPVLDHLVATGQLSTEEAEEDPRRHALRSALLGNSIPFLDTEADPVELTAGEILLLASDGIDTLGPDEICAIALAHKADMKGLACAIVDNVVGKDRADQDNTTVLTLSQKKQSSESETNEDSVLPLTETNSLKYRLKQGWFPIALLAILLTLTAVSIGYWWTRSSDTIENEQISPSSGSEFTPSMQDSH